MAEGGGGRGVNIESSGAEILRNVGKNGGSFWC